MNFGCEDLWTLLYMMPPWQCCAGIQYTGSCFAFSGVFVFRERCDRREMYAAIYFPTVARRP